MAFSNTALIGKAFSPYRKTLTAAEAQAYAAATDDPNPLYTGIQALAPPLAVVTLSLVHGAAPILCDPDLFEDPMLLLRLVHLEEDITWHRPLMQETPLVSQAVLSDVQPRPTGEVFHITTDIRQDAPPPNHYPIATVRTSMFLRGPKSGARGAAMPTTATPAVPPATHQLTWTVAPDQSERYAAASGDHNPIHVDDNIARASGLKGRILHGLCTMAFAQRAVVQHFGDGDPARLQRLRVGFTRPVFMGDTLTCAASAHTDEIVTPRSTAVAFVVNNQADRAVCKEGFALFSPSPR